ncbi:MAG: ankyrin repeat domain-containing protein, partial [Sedimentisphaerales bacterium]
MKRVAMPVVVFLAVVFWNAHSTFAQNEARTLHQAIVDGDIDKVKSLIAKGTDINVTNMLGGTPLHTAISKKQQAIAEFLISKGPDLNARD